jgi:proton-translocating NADH-quinone oxidoreductase chain M
MLSTLILLPLFGSFLLFFINSKNILFIRNFSLFWSLLIFNISIFLVFSFDNTSSNFQFVEEINWIAITNNNIVLGIDGLALFMILLTTFLIPVCSMLSFTLTNVSKVKEYNIAFLVLEAILLGVFSTLDILLFYLLFEAVLIPMYFIVGVYGSRGRRVRASYLLFLYTLISSLFMLLAILFLYFKSGTTDFQALQSLALTSFSEKLCWIAFFLSFAVKMPLIPFHIWLPEAHAEAPTSGSVILAGILLKLGGFGFIRYSLCLFPEASFFFSPLIFTICSFGVVYASLTTLQQVDLKKIIAYSSVGHMGIVTIGIFSGNIQGIIGSIVLMISHGVVSGALFFCIGVLYERHHTRIIKYYNGLINTMPLFMLFFIIFTLGNLGLPVTSSFIGEFLVLVGCFQINSSAALLSGTGMVLGAAYSLWLCNRIGFGNLKTYSIFEFYDLSRREYYTLLPFVFLTFLIGLYPEILISYIRASVISF